MKVEKHIPLLEDILLEYKQTIGEEFHAYRNHVYRMINFCFALKECNKEEREKIIIAGAFHDIGIWIEGTVDYIPPSITSSKDYLKKRNLESWSEEIESMISEHHKLREYHDTSNLLIELFRKGDLVDFSLGIFRFNLPNTFIKEVKAAFPNAGFHMFLMKIATKWFFKHPTRPFPMMKW